MADDLNDAPDTLIDTSGAGEGDTNVQGKGTDTSGEAGKGAARAANADTNPDATPAAKPDAKPDAKGDGKAGDTKPAVKDDVKPDWPDDWREKAAAGDAKKLARLARYASPQAVADALIEAQTRIAKGDLKPVLKKDATPEQIKEYREQLGIPETPDKYDLGKLEITDADKPVVDQILAKAHEMNSTPEMAKANVDAYFAIKQQMAEERVTRDQAIRTEAEDALHKEWGNDFRKNINLVNAFLDNAPTGLKEKLLTGRLSDGTPIGSSPEALRWLLGIELERNPTGTVVPGAGANMAQSVSDEIKAIETKMRENRTAYNKDEKLQARYRQLIEYTLAEKKKAA